MIKPYYQDSHCTIYHGDCREILPQLEQPDTCIVDPVWPNSVFPNIKNPKLLFAEMCNLLTSERVVVHLGCVSDIRFLSVIPEKYEFLRVCWLKYAIPSYRGRILIGSDVAYGFGIPPEPRQGRRVLSGEICARNNQTKWQNTERGNGSFEKTNYEKLPHPCPRRLEHVKFLISTFVNNTVIDLFMGSGTTLRAAKDLNRKAIGIEIEEKYCEIAVERLRQEVLEL